MTQTVLLIRSPSEQTPDPYHEALEAAGNEATSIPILATQLVNIESLASKILAGPLGKDAAASVNGVIMTSGRSVEAWKAAISTIIAQDTEGAADWCTTPFYVVGDKTASELKSLPSSPFLPHVDFIRGAQEAGTAAKLAEFIIHDKDRSLGTLLYLTGDKNRDTLSKTLDEHGIGWESICVYETTEDLEFPKRLDEFISQTYGKATSAIRIVFFAPSAATYAVPHLTKHFILPTISPTNLSEGRASAIVPERMTALLYTIGPTTRDFLQGDMGLRVTGTAAKPNPESLTKVLSATKDPQS
ncbi:tetrapyrrole biosynthesis uroporphyrinogen III synthase [Sistotremastrum niveocremeum HHB9708]|uniref:Tetrapyrrole biosynthesis uroporphyrinogen III synthase n=1 Tax=Sistotremastrum niveocremeum HHB9708 TaxID=1314777 RepID=A0A164WX72_9AGAM|nr:tetrapyrrole biosynthesis uroporphyrinogen III synthase [Sistotremastrum niveocremeum HHB9708]